MEENWQLATVQQEVPLLDHEGGLQEDSSCPMGVSRMSRIMAPKILDAPAKLLCGPSDWDRQYRNQLLALHVRGRALLDTVMAGDISDVRKFVRDLCKLRGAMGSTVGRGGGAPWHPLEDRLLRSMFARGSEWKKISALYFGQRTVAACRGRLKGELVSRR